MPVAAYEIDEHERGLAPWKGEVPLPGWRESHAPLRYVHRNASNESNATANATRGEYNSWRSFSGTRTSGARRFALRGCGAAATHCGFVGASPFDAAAATTRALGAHCHVVILTAVFGQKDRLQQPFRKPPRLAGCYFAFVDEATALDIRQTSFRHPPTRRGEAWVVGAWTLITVMGVRNTSRANDGPRYSPRRASRVPKMLPHRLFPRANYSLWIDGKLRLFMDPLEAVQRFLIDANSILAAPRNLRRDTIDEEYVWITKAFCGGEADPLQREPEWMSRRWAARTSACGPARKQWAQYMSEQRHRPGWQEYTRCIEGALILADLRARETKCLLCNWWSEYSGHSERDQLAFAYVHFMMGMGPRGKGGTRRKREPRVNLLSRRLHWSVDVKADTREKYGSDSPMGPAGIEIAKRVGHARDGLGWL